MTGRVREYMDTSFITVVPSETLINVLDKMIEQEVESCVVIKGGQIIDTVITATQLIAKRDLDFSKTVVGDFATVHGLSVMQQEEYMKDAAEWMTNNHNVDEIVILDNMRPVGILTKQRVLHWMREVKQSH